MDQVIVFRNEFRAKQWAQAISDCQSSGQTVVSWCASHNINIKSYYYWLRKLRLAQIDNLPAEVKSNIQIKPSEAAISFKKLEVQAPLPDLQPAVIIRLPNATLEVVNGAMQQTVEAVLLALRSTC